MAVSLGFVVIGRNEAAHLQACLAAIPNGFPVVYADSGSRDDSVRIAQAAGARTIALTAPPRLTAARGRNAGLAQLLEIAPKMTLVHMVDGDVVLDRDWIATAETAMAQNPRLAAVFGQLRERHPEASIYNRICDREWRVPPGKVAACGGIALFKVEAIQSVGGYNDAIPAGEEPDLCLRMRAKGWEIECLQDFMGTHDAGLTTFGLWWQRARRGGYAYAEHVARNRLNSDPNWVRQVLSIGAWGGAIPLFSVFAAVFAPKLLILPVILWLAMGLRISAKERTNFASASDAIKFGFLTMIGKFAQLLGMLDFSSRSAIQKIRGPSIK